MRKSFVIGACLLAAVVAPTAAFPQILQTPPSLTYEQPVTPQAVQLVQQRLRESGAYAGAVDGIWGADSQASLERFQQTHNLQVTGQLNQATIATLGIPAEQLVSVSLPAVSAPAPILASSLTPRSIQAIQVRLRDLNYYRGAVDGIWGGDTEQALERFQQGNGLQPNGELNSTTVAALGFDPKVLIASP